MTYQDAEKLKQDNINLISQQSTLDSFPYRIKYILIAPKDIIPKERIEVFKLSGTGRGNENALRDLNYLNRNLDLYIFSQDHDKYYEYNLYSYLSETGQNG